MTPIEITVAICAILVAIMLSLAGRYPCEWDEVSPKWKRIQAALDLKSWDKSPTIPDKQATFAAFRAAETESLCSFSASRSAFSR